MGLPSPVRLWVAHAHSPLWVGIHNSAMTPNIKPRLKRQVSPYRTGPQNPRKTTAPEPKNLHRGLPSPVRLWVGIRNSAVTSNIEPRLEETSFTLPHRTQKLQKTTARDPKKLAQGSPQPSQTMGSPGTSPLSVGIRNSAMTPNIEPRLEETSFTLPHRTPKPQKIRGGVSPSLSDYQ